ncbi:MAG: hypothetical protein BMS9Abin24_162 [Thermodesulfobacteriota bacterium]|nr:MAG: hypothetical protein BMS9Abin24_162 [Thermodesulfobacteriota bacterium]
MRPAKHVIYGGMGAAALYPALGADSLWFWSASVLIDVDHYIDFVYHNHFVDLRIKSMFRYHAILSGWWEKPQFLNFELFHTIEFISLLCLLSWWTGSVAFLAITLGFIFHIALDLTALTLAGVPFIRAHSVTEYFIRKRLLARRGLDPAELYREAVEKTKTTR